MNARRLLSGLALAMLAPFLFASPTQAAPALRPTGCNPQGAVQGFATTGGDALDLEQENEVDEYICRRPQHRFYLSVADTPSEVAALRGWLSSGWDERTLFCATDDGAYLIWSLGEISGFDPAPSQARAYDRWASRYADRHDCEQRGIR